MKFSVRRKLALAAVAAIITLGLLSISRRRETPSWCGPKKATIALLDGYGGNSWRQVTTASGKQEALKCPSITKYEYADGQGDTQKSISDIKAMAAKGIDALVVFPDAGPAMLPAITSVYKSGKVIVPYRVEAGGKAGVNYTKFIGTDFKNDGAELGQLDQERAAARRQSSVPERSCRQQPGARRADGAEVGAWARIQVPQSRAVRCDELGSGADAKGSDRRNRQEQQDRRYRLRFRAVAGRRACRCSSNPAARSQRLPPPTAIRWAASGPTSTATTRTSSYSPSRRKTTTFASPCNGRSRPRRTASPRKKKSSKAQSSKIP